MTMEGVAPEHQLLWTRVERGPWTLGSKGSLEDSDSRGGAGLSPVR